MASRGVVVGPAREVLAVRRERDVVDVPPPPLMGAEQVGRYKQPPVRGASKMVVERGQFSVCGGGERAAEWGGRAMITLQADLSSVESELSGV